jgi:hypothetical protein
VAYIESPPWAKWAQRVALSMRYVATGIVGALATQVDVYGPAMPWAGWVVLLSSMAALVGVLAHYYRAEWIALSPLTAGLLAAGVILAGSPASTGIGTFLVLALAITLLDRIVHLTRVAMRLRRMPPKGA